MIRVCPTCQQKYPEDTEFCAQDGTRLEEMQDDSGDALVGRVLDGRWEIEERIGEGGMGAVYRASQRSVDRQVAIKTLRPELCNSREFVDRFFREARVASNIAHPHCVTILDFGQTDDGTLYLAMEFLDGMPLTNRLRHPDLTIREIIQICIQISSALTAAHANNVIHRDLKPDNVFLLSISDGSTFTKVLDFGIAKVTDSEDNMTKTGQVFGTPEYMSPEQCRGDRLDGRSDLYSLGCILYRMLSGRPPFESDTPMAVLVSHVSEHPRQVREVIERDDVPTELADLCMQLLAKHAADRPADAQAVRAALEVMLGQTNSGNSKAVAAQAPATSDEHISGETLATDSAELVKDGGAAAQDSQPVDQPAPHRTEPPSGHTTSPAAVSTPKKSLVPLILGVGVAVVLAAGCAIGGLYAGYSIFFADEGESFDIANIFGSDDESDDDHPAENEEQASAQAATEQNDDAPDDQNEDDENDDEKTQVGADDSVDDSGDDAPSEAVAADDESNEDDPAGAKADDSARAKGGAQKSGGASSGDEETNQKTANVEIHADRADIAVNTNEDDSDRDDSASVGSSASAKARAERRAKARADERAKQEQKQKPPEPEGNIRQTKLSTTGDACIKPNVDSVLRRGQSNFLSCYSSKLGAQPDMSGEVMLAWNISTDGDILRPEVLVSDVKDLDACLLGKLQRLRFDAPIGGRCYVRATYRFSP